MSGGLAAVHSNDGKEAKMSPDPKSNIYAIALLPAVLSMLVASAASAHWGVPDLPREPRDLMYPAASHGGNYM